MEGRNSSQSLGLYSHVRRLRCGTKRRCKIEEVPIIRCLVIGEGKSTGRVVLCYGLVVLMRVMECKCDLRDRPGNENSERCQRKVADFPEVLGGLCFVDQAGNGREAGDY